MRWIALAAVVLALPTACLAAGKIYYGSRAGMQVTVVSMSGIGSSHAVIRAKHTEEDAKAFCVDYEQDRSSACVQKVLRDTRLSDVIEANCKTGVFTTFYGDSLRFVGPAKRPAEGDPKYIIMRGREKLDGSGASGYGYTLDQFAALCPNRASPEE